MFGRKIRLIDIIKNSVKQVSNDEDSSDEDDEDEDKPVVVKKKPTKVVDDEDDEEDEKPKKVAKKPSKVVDDEDDEEDEKPKKVSKPVKKEEPKPKHKNLKLSECPSSALMIGFIDWAIHSNDKEIKQAVAKGFESLTGFKCKEIASKFSEMPKILSSSRYVKLLNKISKNNLSKLGKSVGMDNSVADFVAKYM